LTAAWRGDLLGGVMVINGQWADGSPLIAIPNYARNNRGAGAGAGEAAGGNAGVNYSPGGTAGAAVAPTNAPIRTEAGARRNRGGRTGGSMVWIKSE